MSDEPHRLSRLAEDLISSLRRIPSEDPRGIRRKPSKGVSEVIEALKAKYGIGVPTAEQAIRDVWPQVVGPANASYSNAVRIDERAAPFDDPTRAIQ